jgi:DNA repair protein SbcC/Rad50
MAAKLMQNAQYTYPAPVLRFIHIINMLPARRDSYYICRKTENMTPVSLKIQGLYSYRDTQTIDFTKLAEAKLFGIFGKVGSGKSAVLEAISYALYGETERLGKQDNRAYNMMNLMSGQMSIEFEFYNSGPADKYLFTVSSKRSATNPEDVRTPKRIAYKWENSEWKAMESASAEKILGINYDNFKRTTIIPQNRFMDFLELRPAQRTDMLKELFSLHQFELSPKAKKIDEQNAKELEFTRGRISEIGQAPDELIEKIGAEAAQAETELKAAKELHSKLAAQISQAEKDIKLAEELKKAEELLQHAQKMQAAMAERKTIIDKIARYRKMLGNILSSRNQAAAKTGSLQKKLAEAEKQAESLQLAASKAKQELDSNKTAYDKAAAMAELPAQLKMLAIAASKKTEIENSRERLSKGQTAIDSKRKAKEHLHKQLEALEKFIAENSHHRERLKILQANRSAMIEYGHADEKAQRLKAEVLDLEKNIAGAAADIQKAAERAGLEGPGYEQSATELAANLEAEKTRLQSLIANIAAEQSFAELSGSLQEGQPCPLCGSEKHPHPASIEKCSSKLSEAQAQLRAADARLLETAKSAAEIKQLAQQRKQKQELRAATDKNMHQAVIDRNNLLGKVTGPAMPLHAIEAEIKEAANAEAELEKAEKNLKETMKQASQAAADELRFSEAISQLKETQAQLEAASATAMQQVQQSTADRYGQLQPELMQAEAEKIERQIAQAKSDTEKAEKKLRDTLSQAALAEGGLQANKTELSNTRAEYEAAEQQIAAAIKASAEPLADIAEIEKLLHTEIDEEAERNTISSYYTGLEVKTQAVRALQEQQPAQPADTAVFLAAKLQAEQATAAIEQLSRKIIEARKDLADLRLRKEKLAELKLQASALELRAQNIKTLRELFAGSGFVNYVSTVYLQSLCREANQRFQKLNSNRLSIELGADNSFLVRDYMNNGEMRSIKTLSGGQSFQAALCLALALSDSVQAFSGQKQNFFFLDEGFGSQDTDSLAMIFEALAALRAENKTVGIISHVEALKEEITAFAQIENIGSAGSRISMHT